MITVDIYDKPTSQGHRHRKEMRVRVGAAMSAAVSTSCRDRCHDGGRYYALDDVFLSRRIVRGYPSKDRETCKTSQRKTLAATLQQKTSFWWFLVVVLLCFADFVHGGINCSLPQTEFDALQALYVSANGYNWLWNTSAAAGTSEWAFTVATDTYTPCTDEWQGLTCEQQIANSTVCNIIEIVLSNMNLDGELPIELGNFSVLALLDIDSNNVYGGIPDSISSLSSLQVLRLGSNRLDAADAVEVNGYYVDLSNNMLTGPVSSLTFNSNIMYLNLSNNAITGPLNFLGRLVGLQVIDVSNNSFTGTVPSSLSLLSNVTYFLAASNRVNDTATSAINAFSKSDISYLSLSSNALHGCMPVNLSVFSRLEYLDFSWNSIVCELPKSYPPSLAYFYMNNNRMVGAFPNALAVLPNVMSIRIYNNFLSGKLPTLWYDNGPLSQLMFYTNGFTGSLPDSLGNLRNLTILSGSYNSLTGTIPLSYQQLLMLEQFNFSSNLLIGSISTLFESTDLFLQLQHFNVANNSLTGSIPSNLFGLPNIQHIVLHVNCFNNFPQGGELCTAKQLRSLVVGYMSTADSCEVRDNLSPVHQYRGGEIANQLLIGYALPECLWQLDNLTILHASGNGLSGTIPSQVSASLVSISMSHNYLTGTIPYYLQVKGDLLLFAADFNKLTGILSDDYNVTNYDATIRFAHNRLSGPIPPALVEVVNIDLLTNNLFDCGVSISNDAETQGSYSCGSTILNAAYFVWISTFFAFFFALLIFWQYLRKFGLYLSPVTILQLEDLLPQLEVTSYKWLVLDCLKKTLQYYYYDFSSTAVELHNTQQFLRVLYLAGWGSFKLSAAYVILLTVIYVSFKVGTGDNYSAYQFQYGWIVTSANLRGLAPAVIILLAVLISFVYMCSVLAELGYQASADRNQRQQQEMARVSVLAPNGNNMRPSISVSARPSTFIAPQAGKSEKYDTMELWVAYIWKLFVVIFYQFWNAAVTLAVNLSYILLLIHGNDGNTLSAYQINVMQGCMSLFKVGWNGAYIPFSMNAMHDAGLEPASMLMNQVFMYIMNFILGPTMAVLIADTQCFYYLLSTYVPPGLSFPMEVVTPTCGLSSVAPVMDGSVLSGLSQPVYQCSSVVSQQLVNDDIAPAFLYSFQCGSAVLNDFVPVLLYAFTINALLLPAFRLFMMQISNEKWKEMCPDVLYRVVIVRFIFQPEARRSSSVAVSTLNSGFSEVAQSFAGDSNGFELTDQTDGSGRHVPHDDFQLMKAASTYGSDRVYDSSVVIAKRLLDSSILMTFGIGCPVLGVGVALCVLGNTFMWKVLIGRYLLLSDAAHNPKACNRVEASTSNVSHGVIGSMWIVVISVGLFWCVNMYDIIGDVYGFEGGIYMVCCTAVVLPMSTFGTVWLVRNYHKNVVRAVIRMRDSVITPTNRTSTVTPGRNSVLYTTRASSGVGFTASLLGANTTRNSTMGRNSVVGRQTTFGRKSEYARNSAIGRNTMTNRNTVANRQTLGNKSSDTLNEPLMDDVAAAAAMCKTGADYCLEDQDIELRGASSFHGIIDDPEMMDLTELTVLGNRASVVQSENSQGHSSDLVSVNRNSLIFSANQTHSRILHAPQHITGGNISGADGSYATSRSSIGGRASLSGRASITEANTSLNASAENQGDSGRGSFIFGFAGIRKAKSSQFGTVSPAVTNPLLLAPRLHKTDDVAASLPSRQAVPDGRHHFEDEDDRGGFMMIQSFVPFAGIKSTFETPSISRQMLAEKLAEDRETTEDERVSQARGSNGDASLPLSGKNVRLKVSTHSTSSHFDMVAKTPGGGVEVLESSRSSVLQEPNDRRNTLVCAQLFDDDDDEEPPEVVRKTMSAVMGPEGTYQSRSVPPGWE
jgi:Leucine-rich repeat (LRR) protein